MSQTLPAGPRARVVWEFSLVVLLQAVQVVALLVALVYWFVVNANRGEDNQRRLAELQSNVSGQITELRQALANGLGDVRLQMLSPRRLRSRAFRRRRVRSVAWTAMRCRAHRLRRAPSNSSAHGRCGPSVRHVRPSVRAPSVPPTTPSSGPGPAKPGEPRVRRPAAGAGQSGASFPGIARAGISRS
jgi:hypothetical protein